MKKFTVSLIHQDCVMSEVSKHTPGITFWASVPEVDSGIFKLILILTPKNDNFENNVKRAKEYLVFREDVIGLTTIVDAEDYKIFSMYVQDVKTTTGVVRILTSADGVTVPRYSAMKVEEGIENYEIFYEGGDEFVANIKNRFEEEIKFKNLTIKEEVVDPNVSTVMQYTTLYDVLPDFDEDLRTLFKQLITRWDAATSEEIVRKCLSEGNSDKENRVKKIFWGLIADHYEKIIEVIRDRFSGHVT